MNDHGDLSCLHDDCYTQEQMDEQKFIYEWAHRDAMEWRAKYNESRRKYQEVLLAISAMEREANE